MKSYSDKSNGSDLFVLELLKGKKGGYFIEAGAIDGIQNSNTYLLEHDYGWRGLCVEPDPQLFEKLRKNRKCDCVNACLDETNGTAEFMGGCRGWGGITKHLVKSKSKKWSQGVPLKVKSVTLTDLLKQYRAPAVIDYLSLDTEGAEYVILKSFAFDQYRFQVISIEGTKCNDLLLSKGYRLVANPRSADAPWEQYFVHPALMSLVAPARPSITAVPNPVPPGSGLGTSVINWDTGDGSKGIVYVSVNNGEERLFMKGAKGSEKAAWIGAGSSYEFRLYRGTDRAKLLGSVKLTRSK